MSRLLRPNRAGLVLLLVGLALVLAACSGAGASLAPGQTATPVPTIAPLEPAPLNPDPFSLLSWLYTPIFQALFLLLVGIDRIVPDMGIAIVVMTLLVRTLMVPLMRRQMVSMRRMQAIAPEIKEIQRRFKSDRMKQQQAISALYKERGVSQAGCLTALLPMLLLIPMYTVIRQGLENPDPTAMLRVFGVQIFDVTCNTGLRPNGLAVPCLDTSIPWLGGLDASQPSVVSIFGFGLSILAVGYTVIQLVASRMSLPPHDPNTPLDQNARTQRTMMLWLPLITLFYGGIIPVGLFLYLIVSTIYQIVQQFLTTGWGGMFPLFGWTPAFAVDHQPRFPVAGMPAPPTPSRPGGAPARPTSERPVDRSASAAATIRQRGRQGRRGRRR
jgi:YidC/Oxa1 family membrane protein insertase